MTGMYNVLEQLRRGEPLGPKERQVHEQGLVSVLRQLHDELDAAVLAAYGWADLTGALLAGSAVRTLPPGGTGPAPAPPGGTGHSPRPERLETGTDPLNPRFDFRSTYSLPDSPASWQCHHAILWAERSRPRAPSGNNGDRKS